MINNIQNLIPGSDIFQENEKSKYWRKVGNEETGDKISDFAPQHWSTKRCPGVSRNICVGGAAGLEWSAGYY